MKHPDWPAFLAAIVADPDDDTARLVAADFLEENGDADRAAFIRIQVELARLEATRQGKSLEADHLRAKERAFLGPLSMFRQLWAAEACPELVRMPNKGGGRGPLEAVTVQGADRLWWNRGFVSAVTCPASEWLRHGVAVRARNPVHVVTLEQCDRLHRDQWYEMIPALNGLTGIYLGAATDGLVEWIRGWVPGVEEVSVTNWADDD
jgi:uncharacterized protein (TIGR02996 family)